VLQSVLYCRDALVLHQWHESFIPDFTEWRFKTHSFDVDKWFIIGSWKKEELPLNTIQQTRFFIPQ